MKLQFKFLEIWWLFAALMILAGVTVYVVNILPKHPARMVDGEAYTVDTRERIIVPAVSTYCSKEVEKAECEDGEYDDCQPECRTDSCRKKAETVETAEELVIYDYKGEDNGE